MKKLDISSALKQYSAASVVFLAFGDEAQANIIHRDLEPDSSITSGDTIFLDLDLNGTNDIMFWIESKTGSITTSEGDIVNYLYRFAHADALGYNVLAGDNGSNAGYVFQSAYRFNSGDIIGLDNPPYFDEEALLGAFISSEDTVQYSGGPWSGTDGLFMGIRFIIDSYHHWAWIRLSVGSGGSSVTVTELAYDNVPDISITAGLTTPAENLQEVYKPEMYVSAGGIHIATKDNTVYKIYTIYSMQGQQISSGTIENEHTLIETGNYAAGIYFVRLAGSNNEKYERKIFIHNF